MADKSKAETNDPRGDEQVPGTAQRDSSPGGVSDVEQRASDPPPAGPHASDHLTDESKTPGTGALTERRTNGDADAATG